MQGNGICCAAFTKNVLFKAFRLGLFSPCLSVCAALCMPAGEVFPDLSTLCQGHVLSTRSDYGKSVLEPSDSCQSNRLSRMFAILHLLALE